MPSVISVHCLVLFVFRAHFYVAYLFGILFFFHELSLHHLYLYHHLSSIIRCMLLYQGHIINQSINKSIK